MPRNLTQPARTDYPAERRRREFGELPHVPAVPRPRLVASSVGPDDLELAAAVRAARGIPFPPRDMSEAEALRAANDAVLAWQDADDAQHGRPIYGTQPGPAQGHALRKPRVPLLRWLAVALVLAFVLGPLAMLIWPWVAPFVQDVPPATVLRGEA